MNTLMLALSLFSSRAPLDAEDGFSVVGMVISVVAIAVIVVAALIAFIVPGNN